MTTKPTQSEINRSAPTVAEVNHALAKFIALQECPKCARENSPIKHYIDLGERVEWNPCKDRNQLAMVLEKLTDGQLLGVADILLGEILTSFTIGARTLLSRGLTAPPETVARAVWEVVR